jgi:hypothetical protein
MAMACSRTSQCRLYIPSIPLSSGHSQCKRLFHQTSHLQGISAAGLAKQAAAKESIHLYIPEFNIQEQENVNV